MIKGFSGIDLFCGCGGVTHGFARAGIDMRLGIDSESAYKSTYETNNSARFLAADVRKISARDILPFIADFAQRHLIVSSCAPCQPFSLKNSKRSRDPHDDPRIPLGFELIRIVDELEKEGVICSGVFIENVPEFLKSPIWIEMRSALLGRGFSVAHKVINCADYGVPQSRRRFIAVAVRGWQFLRMPAASHGSGLLPHRTVRDAFSGLSSLSAGQECERIANHQTRCLSPLNFQRISSVPLNGGSRSSFPKELVLECHKDFDGHKDVYGRMNFDTPSPTITTRCISITNGRYGHPEEHRGISVREAARLQTFPDNFVFCGKSIEADARMIGNAVPVAVAELFGEYLVSTLTKLFGLKSCSNNEQGERHYIAA
jgi:DNA (cytosine-5)-methyltransferase 1